MTERFRGEPRPSAATPAFPFFVGMGRSGTTLFRAMFDSHPEMSIPGESGFIVRLGRRRGRYERNGSFVVEPFVADLLEHRGFRRWGLPEQDVRAALANPPLGGFTDAVRRLYALHAAREGKPRYGDKTPNYVLSLPLLADMFPEARFVHIIRDGRDVALSHLDIKEWGPDSVEEAAVEWRRNVRKGMRDGSRLGVHRYREVRYEDLLDRPEATLVDLCGFLDLPFHPAMLTYAERAADVLRTEAFPQHHSRLASGPTKNLRDWRRDMTPADASRFEAIAGGLLSELGYDRGTGGVTPRDRLGAGLALSRLGVKFVRRAHMGVRRRAASRLAQLRALTAGGRRP